MRVLVTGAYGFIGAQIAAALSEAGHDVICAVRGTRRDERFAHLPSIGCDMAADVHERDWLPRLAGIDAVVNCAGILRERGNDRYECVHVQAPLALFRACASSGVRRVVQISALGDPADGEFIASKHRCDTELLALDLDAIVLRPSIVYSAAGSYGGTSLLRALAALPATLLLPGDGRQRLQPIDGDDLGRAVVAALAHAPPLRGTWELVGAQIMTLAEYLRAWRAWLGLGTAREWQVPRALVRSGAWFGETFGHGPLGATMPRMLERGNVGAGDALARMQRDFGIAPRSLAQALGARPAQTQDRWHARLYFALPALRITLALLWIGSGLLGLLSSAEVVAAAASAGPLSADAALALARASGALDLVLGVLCLARWRPRLVLGGMLAMLFGYTFALGVFWPQHWLDPFGGLAKNVPLFVALWVLLATEERR
jgi:uncharacterized protein YbjT (DUF2867 family)/uncharacterized membrane protein YphA (DoxX/SURF4 family)